ncbi:MAG: polyprenyl synthetase family protein [Prevotellaceae bacterium]|jgi:octaprenyl-diphosphate synthase|nr:polyprenyl synthetase family protein [Prevotellaceae bacterium]
MMDIIQIQAMKGNTKRVESGTNKRCPDVYNSFPKEVRDALNKFETFFRKSLFSDSPLLNEVIKYIFDRHGKKIRPACVFLSAMASAPSEPFINDKTFAGTAAIEMVHTASIVHDDVVDRSDQRRGNKSVNAEWTSRIAVLAGDYLMAKALVLITEYQMFDFMNIMSYPIAEMSVGEMIQIEKSIALDTTEEIYFEIIRKKTAVLIGASMEVGAKSSGASHLAETMYRIGENVGMAFQIKDDIFDYEKTNLLGKPTGNDVVENKITLPLIYALKQVDNKRQKEILKCVKHSSTDRKYISTVRDFVLENDGLTYATSVAEKYVEKAIDMISILDDSPAKQSLISLARYVTKRNE